MKKAFLSLAVAALFSFAIVACGGAQTEQEPEMDDMEYMDEAIDELEPVVEDWEEVVEGEEVIAE